MRTSTAIRARLQENALRMKAIQEVDAQLSRVQQIEIEYLMMEAETFNDMLGKLNNSWWRRLISPKQARFTIALLAMSLYVVSIYRIFSTIDLSQVEQWEFVATALPFWLICALVPIAMFTLIVSKDHKN